MSDRQTVVNVNLTAPATGVPLAPQPAKSLGTAILLWWFLGIFGVHRLYLEQPHAKTMLILGVTVFGLFVTVPWALIDAFSLSKWVKESGPVPLGAASYPGKPKELQTRLLEEAERRKGRLTVTQAVKATGESFADVEKCLEEMHSSGYVEVANHSETGVVVYVFAEIE